MVPYIRTGTGFRYSFYSEPPWGTFKITAKNPCSDDVSYSFLNKNQVNICQARETLGFFLKKIVKLNL